MTACSSCGLVPTLARASAVVLVVRSDGSTSCVSCWVGRVVQMRKAKR